MSVSVNKRAVRVISFLAVSALMVLMLPRLSFGAAAGVIKLPQPRTTGGRPLMQALKDRCSQRQFSGRQVPLQVLSDLLWAACGVNRPESGKRTNPTAMDYREIEVYVAKKDGLYKYEPLKHELAIVLRQDVRASTGSQDFVAKAALNLIYVADLSRIGGGIKDKEMLAGLDTGFVSQSVYLFCASEGLATVVRGWFDREKLEKKMGLRPDKRVMLCQSVGYPAK